MRRFHQLSAAASPGVAGATHWPASLGAGELDQLRQAGFSEPAALEVLEVAAFFNYVNRLTLALNIVPDQQFFAH